MKVRPSGHDEPVVVKLDKAKHIQDEARNTKTLNDEAFLGPAAPRLIGDPVVSKCGTCAQKRRDCSGQAAARRRRECTSLLRGCCSPLVTASVRGTVV